MNGVQLYFIFSVGISHYFNRSYLDRSSIYCEHGGIFVIASLATILLPFGLIKQTAFLF